MTDEFLSEDGERRKSQLLRAQQIAHQLTNGRVTHNIIKSIHELVIADERTDLPEFKAVTAPAPGARQVLAKKPKSEQLALL